jgi:hypothetical protein
MDLPGKRRFHHQDGEGRTYKRTCSCPAFGTIAGNGLLDFLVALAVSREPLSRLQFPANREFRPSFTHGTAGIVHNSRRLDRRSGPGRSKKNRGFFRGIAISNSLLRIRTANVCFFL